MKSFLKDYSRSAIGNVSNYDPIKLVNEDLDKHSDWKVIQVLNSDNYHFYVVYEIKAPRKPRVKKGEPAPVEVPYVEPTLETIEKVPEEIIDDDNVVDANDEPYIEIPKMVDLINGQDNGIIEEEN